MKTLTLAAIITSVILLAGTLGFVISSPDAFARAPPGGGGGAEKVTICHKPGTPAENTITVSVNALPAHIAHGDFIGTCEEPTTPDFLECFCRDGTVKGACIASCDIFDCTELCGEIALGRCLADANVCLPR